ncbi:MAG: NUDIX domain-containing protein [Saprospiraceae bacterium]|nr:NUDIX domain-containing protein [Saprospiraceae bacterium]
MPKVSAGLLLFRRKEGSLQFLLGHMGGPFWQNKDQGAWTIPKGEFDPEEEEPFDAAKREFEEETGTSVEGNFLELQPIKQKSGKIVWAWALEKDLDELQLRSNTFEIEWPPKSKKLASFQEIDKWRWMTGAQAQGKVITGQQELLAQLEKRLSS